MFRKLNDISQLDVVTSIGYSSSVSLKTYEGHSSHRGTVESATYGKISWSATKSVTSTWSDDSRSIHADSVITFAFPKFTVELRAKVADALSKGAVTTRQDFLLNGEKIFFEEYQKYTGQGAAEAPFPGFPR